MQNNQNKTYKNPIDEALSVFPTRRLAAKKISELAGYSVLPQSLTNWIAKGYVPATLVSIVYRATKRQVPKRLLNPISHG